MTPLEQIMQAALVASADVREEALRVLRGQARAADSTPVPSAPEPFLTLREVAKRLGFSPCTLWRWQVPGHDLGGRRRFKLPEVVEYLASDSFKRRTSALRARRRNPKAD